MFFPCSFLHGFRHCFGELCETASVPTETLCDSTKKLEALLGWNPGISLQSVVSKILAS